MSVTLIPWPETIWTAHDRLQSRTPIGLSRRGVEKLESWFDQLRESGVREIAAAGVMPGEEIAARLVRALGAKSRTDADLAEVNAGLWDGLTHEELERRYERVYKKWWSRPASVSPPGGESVEAACDRLSGALERFACRSSADAVVSAWAAINSGTRHLAGLQRQLEAIEAACAELELPGERRRIDLPPQRTIGADGAAADQPLGQALVIDCRPGAPRRVLLNIHYDTVYGAEHAFQAAEETGGGRLRGPGVADAKGGLVVMLTALAGLERGDSAGEIGWRVVLNPDEEVGSPGSRALLGQCAAGADLALVYEPALPDGHLIGPRKGSGNFDLVIRGRSAHAGRDPERGRNAVHAAAEAAGAITALAGQRENLTVNVGRIDGGGPVNVVPDLAIVRCNVRVQAVEDVRFVEEGLREVVADINGREGFAAELHGHFAAPPKPMTPWLRQLLEGVAATGRELGLELGWRSSGGVCDGNRLAAAGLPVVDTLGVVGGHIHSENEYVELASLTERAKLTALLLHNLAAGKLDWPIRQQPDCRIETDRCRRSPPLPNNQ